MSISFDISTLAGNFKTNLKRFPSALGFNVMLCIVLLFFIWNNSSWEDKLTLVSIYYLSVGFLLSMSLKLWSEEVNNKRIAIYTKILLQSVLLLDAIYLYNTEPSSWMEISLARTAAISTLIANMFILPFYREKNDIASWNLTIISIGNFGIAIFISFLMFSGASLLISSLEELFGLALNEKWYFTTWIICMVFLSTLLFIGLQPLKEKKTNKAPIVLAFFNKVIRFLFVPLLGAYLLVLYSYAAKTLIQWELPNGWVSILITTLMMGCIAIEFWLYPSTQQEGIRFDKLIARWLPIFILPLLLLMSIGIIRRISDYGITINRLYISALNLWYYIVCIGLIINKNKRIHWIPISFAILFIVTSLFPINFTCITRNVLLKEIKNEILTTYKGELPMNDTLYEEWLSVYPKDKSLQINEKISYIDNTFGQEYYKHLFTDVNFYKYRYKHLYEQNENLTYMISESQRLTEHFTIDLSEGYSSITCYKSESIVIEEEKDYLTITLQQATNETINIKIQTSDIYNWGKMNSKKWVPQELPCSTTNYKFVLTDFSYNNNYTNGLKFTYSGYLLKK